MMSIFDLVAQDCNNTGCPTFAAYLFLPLRWDTDNYNYSSLLSITVF